VIVEPSSTAVAGRWHRARPGRHPESGDPLSVGATTARSGHDRRTKGGRCSRRRRRPPVEILGLQGVPDAATRSWLSPDEATARQVAEHSPRQTARGDLVKTAKVTLEDLYAQIQAGDVKELRVVLKATCRARWRHWPMRSRACRPMRCGSTCSTRRGRRYGERRTARLGVNAVVIGFNVRPEPKATDVAEREGVELRLYTVIYDAINEIRDAMEGLLEPTVREKTVAVRRCARCSACPRGGRRRVLRYGRQDRAQRPPCASSETTSSSTAAACRSSCADSKEDAREWCPATSVGIGLENFGDIKTATSSSAVEPRAGRPATHPAGKSAGAERASEPRPRRPRRRSVRSRGDCRGRRWLRLTLFLPENHSLKGKLRRVDQGPCQQHLQRVHRRV